MQNINLSEKSLEVLRSERDVHMGKWEKGTLSSQGIERLRAIEAELVRRARATDPER